MQTLGVIAGVIGGGICILAGLIALFIGLAAMRQPFGQTLPPGLYLSFGLYFIGKGCVACGLSFTTGVSGRRSN